MYNHRNEEKWLVPMHTYIYTYIIVICYYTIQLNFCTFSLYKLNKSDVKTHSCYSPPCIFVYSLKLFSVYMKTSKSYRLQDFLIFEGAPCHNLSNAFVLSMKHWCRSFCISFANFNNCNCIYLQSWKSHFLFSYLEQSYIVVIFLVQFCCELYSLES